VSGEYTSQGVDEVRDGGERKRGGFDAQILGQVVGQPHCDDVRGPGHGEVG